MLETVRKEIDDQRRIVIPKEWCDKMKIKEHTTVEMVRKEDKIEITPVRKKSLMDFKGTVGGGDVVDIEEGEKAQMEAAWEDFENSRKRSIENIKKRHKK